MDIAFDASSLVPLKKEVQGCEVTRSSSSSSFKLRCTQAALQTLWAAGMQAKRSKAGTQQKREGKCPDRQKEKTSWRERSLGNSAKLKYYSKRERRTAQELKARRSGEDRGKAET